MQIINALFGGNLVVTIIVIAILIFIFTMLKGKYRYIIGTAATIYVIGIVFNQQDQVVRLINILKSAVSTILGI